LFSFSLFCDWCSQARVCFFLRIRLSTFWILRLRLHHVSLIFSLHSASFPFLSFFLLHHARHTIHTHHHHTPYLHVHILTLPPNVTSPHPTSSVYRSSIRLSFIHPSIAHPHPSIYLPVILLPPTADGPHYQPQRTRPLPRPQVYISHTHTAITRPPSYLYVHHTVSVFNFPRLLLFV
jgi:hypothetical protein